MVWLETFSKESEGALYMHDHIAAGTGIMKYDIWMYLASFLVAFPLDANDTIAIPNKIRAPTTAFGGWGRRTE